MQAQDIIEMVGVCCEEEFLLAKKYANGNNVLLEDMILGDGDSELLPLEAVKELKSINEMVKALEEQHIKMLNSCDTYKINAVLYGCNNKRDYLIDGCGDIIWKCDKRLDEEKGRTALAEIYTNDAGFYQSHTPYL